MVDIKFVKRQYGKIIYTHVLIDGRLLSDTEVVAGMGCSVHPDTFFITGYNQGGYDSVTFCLKCCKDILDNCADLETAEIVPNSEFFKRKYPSRDV